MGEEDRAKDAEGKNVDAATYLENHQVPWALIRAFGLAIRARAPSLMVNLVAAPELPRQQIEWNTSCEIVLGALHNISPEMEAFAAATIADPRRLRLNTVPAGRGGGRCWSEDPQAPRAGRSWIEFDRDGTLNDPIYLAHELGHLWAAARLPPGEMNPNMAESQAFFAQAALYDRLFSMLIYAEGARSHFRSEIGEQALTLPLCLLARQTFHDAVSPAACEAFLADAYGPSWRDYPPAAAFDLEDEALLFRHARNLHRHQMGALIGTGLWIGMHEYDLPAMAIADALYPRSQHCIGEALASLGWLRPEDIARFAELAITVIELKSDPVGALTPTRPRLLHRGSDPQMYPCPKE